MIEFIPAIIASLVAKLVKALGLPLKKGPPIDKL